MRQHDLPGVPNWQRLSPTYRKHIERRINTSLVIQQIEVCRFRVRIEHALVQIERNRRMADAKKTVEPKNPKLRGLISGIERFRHDVDRDIDKAVGLLEGAHERRQEVFAKVTDHIGDKVADINSLVDHFDDLDAVIGDNGGPSLNGGSEGSQEGSAISTASADTETKE